MQSLSERNISFGTLRDRLRDLDARKVDTVKAATDITVTPEGRIAVREDIPGTGDYLDTEYEPNDVFVGQLADTFKTGTPLTRRLFAERPDVAADLFNGLMHGNDMASTGDVAYPADARSFLFRGYAEHGGEAGTARAPLSNQY